MLTKAPKAAICDAEIAARAGLRLLLQEGGFEIAGEAANLEDTLRTVRDLGAEVMFIVDFNLDREPGVTLLDRLREHDADLRTLIYSARENVRLVSAAYSHGALAYVTKTSSKEVLIEAARQAADGNKYFMPGMAERLARFHTDKRDDADPTSVLSPAELRMFVLLADGAPADEIAERLGITKKTVQNGAVTIRHKLGIPRAHFTLMALKYNLISPQGILAAHEASFSAE